MSSDPAPAPPKPPTERQRWMAAQCLAAGQSLVAAAAFASVPFAELRRLDAEDEGFRELRAWEADRAAEPPEAWARRMELLTRQAIERALADGRVSTVNALLRLGLALPSIATTPGGRAAAQRALCGRLAEDEEVEDGDGDGDGDRDDDGDLDDDADEADPAAWPADVPVVEADPAKEAERRRLLAAIGHEGLRKTMMRGTLYDLEQFHAVGDPDPTVYEEWFARQPKPEFKPVQLSEEDRAAIRRVTRHNPPWIRGEYLGFYRKPVPRELFGQEHSVPANDDAGPHPGPPPRERGGGSGTICLLPPPSPPAGAWSRSDQGGGGSPPIPPANPLEALRARVARLLDRTAPRLPEELDLAEAVCALKWPKWPGYAGPVDLDLLRLALRDVAIDTETLNWLGGHELAKACKTAEERQPKGP